MTIRTLTASLLAFALIGLGQAEAALITVSSGTFDQGDGSILVTVRLDNDSASALQLAAFSLDLNVTSVSSRRVEFDPTSQPATLTASTYVFYGNSAAESGSVVPWTVASVSGGVNNAFTFTDTTDDTLDVSLAPFASRLLANIRLKPGAGAAAPLPGDVFTIDFVLAGTSIYDQNLDPVAFTTQAGTLTVLPSSNPVPEPATLGMACLALLGFAVRTRVRRRAMALRS